MSRLRQRRRFVVGFIISAALVAVATLSLAAVLLAGLSSPSSKRSDLDMMLTPFRGDDDDDLRFSNADAANREPPPSSGERRGRNPRVISLDGDERYSPIPRKIKISSRARKEQERLAHSRDFRYRDPLREGECVPMQRWQETSFPNCNGFHELDFRGSSLANEFEYYDHGGYNHIFWLNERDKGEDPELIIKILKYGTVYSDRNFDRVRRDGLISERLTRSPHVLDIYGFCGFDILTPFAKGGTLSDKMRRWRRGDLRLSPRTRLRYAFEIAAGLADVHDIDGEGLSSVAHGDLKSGQYLFQDDVIKLGDFNRGRFLRRNSTAPDTACPYTIGKNDGAFRSPEEYEYLPQTSAIDVYALGSLLYKILTGRDVWYDTDTDRAQRYIRRGRLPEIPEHILRSDDPVDRALMEAISMCNVFDPTKRAKARDVSSFLRRRLSELQ